MYLPKTQIQINILNRDFEHNDMKNKLSIDILEHNTINPLYVKANIFLLDKYKQQFDEILDKEALLETLWTNEFRAELGKVKTNYCKIIFKNELDLSIFKMKFF